MFNLEDEKKMVAIREMIKQIEELFTDLRFEYLDMARKYDDAMERVTELEADKIYLEDVLAGREDF